MLSGQVSQVLRLLRLDPEVIDTLLALGDPLPGRTVNEHALRALVDLPAREQRRQLELMLGTAARRPRGARRFEFARATRSTCQFPEDSPIAWVSQDPAMLIPYQWAIRGDRR